VLAFLVPLALCDRDVLADAFPFVKQIAGNGRIQIDRLPHETPLRILHVGTLGTGRCPFSIGPLPARVNAKQNMQGTTLHGACVDDLLHDLIDRGIRVAEDACPNPPVRHVQDAVAV
jgi:hypothetical protein